MKRNVRKNTISGFTITELMVATGIVSVIFLVGSSVITQLFSFQKDVNSRMMDNFSVVNFHKSLTSDLEGAYWPRYGGFNCASSQPLMMTKATQTVDLNGKDSFIEFVTADFSTTVGVVPGTGELAVSVMKNLQVGEYVVLSLATNSASASLFKITKMNRQTGRLELSAANLDMGGTQCESSMKSTALTDFFSPSTKSNVIMTRVYVIQYRIKDGVLTRSRLPGSSNERILDKVTSMRISATWDSSSDENSEKYGQMEFNVKISGELTSLMGKDSRIQNENNVQAKFALNSFQYMNQYASTGAPTVSKKFPTCSVASTFQPGVLKYDPWLPAYKNMIPVSITGFVSEQLQMPSIDISLSPEQGADIMCFKHDYTLGVKHVTGNGIRGSISLTQPSGNFDVYTCAAKGRIQVSASLSYFDTDINQVKTIQCSSDYINAPTQYVFNGKVPNCNRDWGTIKVGDEMFSAAGDVSLGNLSVDMGASCEWAGEEKGNSAQTGIADDCYAWNHWGRDLKRVYFRPYQMQVQKKGGPNAFPDAGAYVDCN